MDAKHVVSLQGRDYCLYAGVLAEAHERGLQSIETQLLQIPDESNGHTAIVKAIVRLKDGSFFEDYGDANPRNTSATMAKALIRLASTRAKGRALRDSVNIGVTMQEELGDEPDHTAAPRNGHQTPHAAARARDAAGSGSGKTGFEPEFRQGTSTKVFRRADLLAGAKALIEQAESLGIEHEAIEPEQTANEGLLSFGLGLKPKVAAAVAAAQAGAEAA